MLLGMAQGKEGDLEGEEKEEEGPHGTEACLKWTCGLWKKETGGG